MKIEEIPENGKNEFRKIREIYKQARCRRQRNYIFPLSVLEWVSRVHLCAVCIVAHEI
jgi:hypothetical protein